MRRDKPNWVLAAQPNNGGSESEGKPATFGFLGLTHTRGTTRKTGRFIVKRQTIRKRLAAELKAVKAELRHRWHVPVPQLGRWLRSGVHGWFNCQAVPGNIDRLNAFRSQVLRGRCRTLRRRRPPLTALSDTFRSSPWLSELPS